MTILKDDVVEKLRNTWASVNPFHNNHADLTNPGNVNRPAYAPQRAPFTPYREPRTQEPSFASPIYSALPLSSLNAYRHSARLPGNLDPHSGVTAQHHYELLKPIEVSRAATRQGFVQNLPRKAFTPRSERNIR